MSIYRSIITSFTLLGFSTVAIAEKDLTERHSHETARLEIIKPVNSSKSSGTIKVTSLEDPDCDDCVFTYRYDSNTKVVFRKSRSEVDPTQLHRFKQEIAQVYADGEGYIWMIGFSDL